MNFIQLVKFKKEITRGLSAGNLRLIEPEGEAGVRTLSVQWTLGQCDAVMMEAPDEQAAMKTALARGEWAQVETLVAVPAVEARRLVE